MLLLMMVTKPFYLDWTFWTVIVSLLALLLSQFPPLHILLKPKRLDVEVHSRIVIHHKVGNPNLSVLISLRNAGGRELKVRSMQVDLERDEKSLVSLPAQGYFESQSSKTALLFVPFSLKPNESWQHTVSFCNVFDRATEKSYREAESYHRLDIMQKLRLRSSEEKVPAEADLRFVDPFVLIFHRLFM